MIRFLPFVLLALFVSCRSHKDVQHDIALNADSVTAMTTHRTISEIDSVVGSMNIVFDTLEVDMQQQADELPKIIRMRAVNGKLDLSHSHQRQAVEIKSSLDSTAYTVSSAEKSSEQTASINAYNPPNTTVIGGVALIIVAIIIFIFYRKR